jgi:hypothetical protein
MLIAACTPNRIARPDAAKRANSADHDKGEQRQQHQAQDNPEFLRRHREGCGGESEDWNRTACQNHHRIIASR